MVVSFICIAYNFQSFMYQFRIHEIALFGRFWGPYSPKNGPNLPNILIRGRTHSNSFEEIEFLWKRDGPKVCTFGPTLTIGFLVKMAEIKKNTHGSRKTLAIELFQFVKIKALSPLHFPGKIRLLFALIGLFFAKYQNQSLTYYISPTRFLVNFL